MRYDVSMGFQPCRARTCAAVWKRKPILIFNQDLKNQVSAGTLNIFQVGKSRNQVRGKRVTDPFHRGRRAGSFDLNQCFLKSKLRGFADFLLPGNQRNQSAFLNMIDDEPDHVEVAGRIEPAVLQKEQSNYWRLGRARVWNSVTSRQNWTNEVLEKNF